MTSGEGLSRLVTLSNPYYAREDAILVILVR